MLNAGSFWRKISISIGLLGGCTYVVPSNKEYTEHILRLVDTVYEASVHSVRCYAARGEVPLAPPIKILGETASLHLRFDVIGENYESYALYLVRCRANWQPMQSASRAFLSGINQFYINDFEYQANLQTPYVSYHTALPQVLQAGNYVAVVHKAGDRKSLLLSVRFMVYEPKIQVEATISSALSGQNRAQQHRIMLVLQHNGLPNLNPYRNLLVYIRQNRNWLSIRRLKRPFRIRDGKILIYDHSYGESNFCALPSFRRFDIRRMYFEGTGIMQWKKDANGHLNAYAHRDHARAEVLKVPINDINGGYFLENNNATQTNGAYIQVHLQLITPEPISSPIHVLGRFNHWSRSKKSLMRYDSAANRYTTALMLKQGYYEYLYWTNKAFEELEGCTAVSENEYEIMVYHLDRSRWTEPMVGYLRLSGRP